VHQGVRAGFAQCRKRLILIVPLGFTLPIELEDDVNILDFDAPSYAELADTYDRLIEGIPDVKRPRFNAEQKDPVLSNGAGMTASEFENAISRALVTHSSKLPNVNFDAFAGGVLRVKTEVVKRSEVLEVMEAGTMADIGGLQNLKNWVSKRALCFSQEALDFGIQPPKGVLLAGPPGTGSW
jgi:SpoVK/Ycf46/Vps4 family AAA+-type ATPase